MKRILLVGSGWRAETWAELIMKLPEFSLAAIVCRNEEKARRFALSGAPTVRSYEEGLQAGADCVLVCVSKQDGAATAGYFSERGIPVLCETPAGCNDAEYEMLERSRGIFFAEQYPLQPRFAALKQIVTDGLLGRVHTLFLSCCHEYHAVAVIRRLLGTGERLPKVSAFFFQDEYSVNGGRRGKISPEVKQSRRTLAVLDFGDARAFYDFSKEQYFSAIRQPKIILQGTHGELVCGQGFLRKGESDVPCSLSAVYDGREGSLYPPDLSEIYFSGKKVYENRWKGLRLSEEEIAMAECLKRFSCGEGYTAHECVLDARIAEALK